MNVNYIKLQWRFFDNGYACDRISRMYIDTFTLFHCQDICGRIHD